MTDIRAKVAYLHGLAEGLDISETSAEGRVLASMIDVLGDLASQVEDVTEAQQELVEYVEDVDFDLGALEETLFGEADAETIRFIPEMTLDEDDGITMLGCPVCGETLAAGGGDLDAPFDVVCPSCGCLVCSTGEAMVESD